jgi:Sushi repeat (SCR repeat)
MNDFCFFLAGTTKVGKILQNDETLTDEQGMLSACTSFSQNEPLMVHLPDKRRLSGIRITSGTDKTVQRFQKANFSFAGDDAVPHHITYQRNNLSDSMSFFVFTNLTEELSVLSIKLASSQSFTVCQLEIYALPNQCGHPEIPINGNVIWQRGSTSATYSCHEGYSLEPNTTRTCQKGKWSGSEPICMEDTATSSDTEDTAITTAQIPL